MGTATASGGAAPKAAPPLDWKAGGGGEGVRRGKANHARMATAPQLAPQAPARIVRGDTDAGVPADAVVGVAFPAARRSHRALPGSKGRLLPSSTRARTHHEHCHTHSPLHHACVTRFRTCSPTSSSRAGRSFAKPKQFVHPRLLVAKVAVFRSVWAAGPRTSFGVSKRASQRQRNTDWRQAPLESG